ncbi:hypothetical protein DFH09DRAFT_482565 [Mycena vulgaris]|nr:hypothetical protein DFH09DRAFT_482565 [Mycena vulgaris]
MSLGPILLRQRFKHPVYYTHFVALVRLLYLCLQFEISTTDIDTIETGMAEWVQEFEKLYYQYKLDRLPVCTLPIHGLLHIAPSIRIVGPSWCYWAYPMERFCGSLLPAIKSRRHPWASIDRRILELTQLFQLKAVYSLSTSLDLRRRRKLEKSGMALTAYPAMCTYPSTRSSADPRNTAYPNYKISCDIVQYNESENSPTDSFSTRALGKDTMAQGRRYDACKRDREAWHTRYDTCKVQWHLRTATPLACHQT